MRYVRFYAVVGAAVVGEFVVVVELTFELFFECRNCMR